MAEPDEVTWLGHSTALVELDGVRVLTDPALRLRMGHLRRAWAPDPAALRDLDAVLVSHLHHDNVPIIEIHSPVDLIMPT